MSGHNFSTEDPSGPRRPEQTQRSHAQPDAAQSMGRSFDGPVSGGLESVESVLHDLGALVVVLDRQGRIVRFNKACQQLTGYTSQEVKGRRVWDLLLIPEEVDPVRQVFERLRSNQLPSDFKNHWVTRDGRRRLIMWSNTVVPDEQGGVELVIGTGIDITREEQTQKSLRKAQDELKQQVEQQTVDLAKADRRIQDLGEYRDRAETAEAELEAQRLLSLRADRLRSLGQMAAGIAHELNQPLVGVRGLAEHLLIGIDRGWDLSEEKLREKLSLIIDQADRMSHIIQRVRMFSNDAGQPESLLVQVNGVVQGALSMLGPQLQARGVTIDQDLTEGLPLVRVNPMSLEEVLLNLLVNAADALTEASDDRAGSTPLRILVRSRTNCEGGSERAQIQVIDEGVGIPDHLLARVFEPFMTTKGPDRGTGLGLAICRYIVEQVSGVISIESALGQGTTVTVSLPAATEIDGVKSGHRAVVKHTTGG